MVDLEILEGKNDLCIYRRGPGFSEQPLPSVIYLALSGKESLLLDPINQPVEYLLKSPVNIFSFTLPGHGPGLDNKEAMKIWAEELGRGVNFVEEFTAKAIENIHFLIDTHRIHPNYLALAGLSRGAFMAAHLAAKEDSIQTLLGFAPLTSLNTLDEFEKGSLQPIVNNLSLSHCVDKLSKKQIRFYIGNRDTRVGTKECFDLLQALVNSAYESGIRSPPLEMIITPSIGYKGHGTSPQIFQEGIKWLKQKLQIEN